MIGAVALNDVVSLVPVFTYMQKEIYRVLLGGVLISWYQTCIWVSCPETSSGRTCGSYVEFVPCCHLL